MASLGKKRCRIKLMGEETFQGAGGRMVTTDPIIADVWADMGENSGGQNVRGSRQFIGEEASFRTRYKQDYTATRKIGFGTKIYKVRSLQITTGLTPEINFQTTLLTS